MKLGVCYYPEHWPEAWWQDDARAMAALGLTYVRIGEFAWSRIEGEPGVFTWEWLDRAIATLHAEGLRVVLGTPTATPPKWLIDRSPDILAHTANGRPRRFGSRRHYSFSSETYRAECTRIVTALAERYGAHPAVAAWQTDNEYGCHDTTFDHGPEAARRFRIWLADRYGTIGALNAAWGNVFWSMEYRSFEEVDPPNSTVTEANPSHRLDWNRFASDEVVSFNRLQTDILRRHSPGRDVIHNFMGFYTEFDHFDVGRDLDVASWDSYPLGFLEQFWFPAEEKARYLRQGHPDVAAFHHDLYRACGRGRWWVMEQQPGPVNWARYNPAPLPGMVRAWTWEALAHGAEVVSYFRWRQAPFAQEQMHAGLHLPDRSKDVGATEARQVAGEIKALGDFGPRAQAPVALVLSYPAIWMTEIQPQGAGFTALRTAFEMYSSLRALGLDVDILSPDADFEGYRLIAVPMLTEISAEFATRVAKSDAAFLFGPRSGSKTASLQIPSALPPGPLQALMAMRVTRVESLRPGASVALAAPFEQHRMIQWREWVCTEIEPRARYADGGGAWYAHGRFNYLAGWPDAAFRTVILKALAAEAGLETVDLPEGVRISRVGETVVAINYAAEAREVAVPEGAQFRLGSARLDPAGVAIWSLHG
jgi:beta-galactosidase